MHITLFKSFTYSQVLFIFLIFSFLVCKAEMILSKELPKTKDTSAVKKESQNTLEETTDGEVAEEEEKIDPFKTYKLVAVYLVGNKPKALIKDLTKPEEGTKEFQVGDYLNEEQSISVSRITMNPTVRIELVDNEGLSYVIKPQSGDSKDTGTAKSKSTFGYMSTPSYFSGGSGNVRQKTKKQDPSSASQPSALPQDKPVSPDTNTKSPQSPQDIPGGQQEGSLQAAPSNQQGQEGKPVNPEKDSITKTEGAKSNIAKPQTASPGTDNARPKNPFGD